MDRDTQKGGVTDAVAKSGGFTNILVKPCLGRPFHLGMLYDCRSDHLIPGVTLWGPETLNKAVVKPQECCDFEVISEDSLSEKTFRLEVDAELKLSLLSGLVNVEGAAKFQVHWGDSRKVLPSFFMTASPPITKLESASSTSQPQDLSS